MPLTKIWYHYWREKPRLLLPLEIITRLFFLYNERGISEIGAASITFNGGKNW